MIMTSLERFRPDPIPSIHPLPEYLATGERAGWYEDMRRVLQVPWMGVVTMAYAHYPTFFRELWQGLKPICESRVLVEAAQELRRYMEMRTAELRPSVLVGPLNEMGYAPREIDDIRRINTVFSHGNQFYLLIATATRYLLEVGHISGAADAEPFTGRHGPDVQVPFVLMEAHHADEPTKAVYQDIKGALGLPFVNTDYRAFARWPSYLRLAWADLRKSVGTPAYESICQACHDWVVVCVSERLPNPRHLSPDALCAAAETDGNLEEVVQVCRLFQWLLPGLITNVAYFRHQLEAVS